VRCIAELVTHLTRDMLSSLARPLGARQCDALPLPRRAARLVVPMEDDDLLREPEGDAERPGEFEGEHAGLLADMTDDDGVQEVVDATHATVHSALDRIRASREILADSLKPIDELLDDMRASGAAGGRTTHARSAEHDASAADAPPSA
jgi:hypothetical protein